MGPADNHWVNGNPPSTDTRERWVRVGRTALPDARDAARDVLAQAVGASADARLLVVFADHDYDLEALVAELHAGGRGAELIGCSTAGEIGSDGPGDDGVVLVAFGGSGFSVVTSCAEGASASMRDAGRHVAHAVAELDERAHTILMTFTDTLAGDQQDVLRGIYHELGAAVPVVGGCAGDKLKMEKTYQFHGSRVLTNAVVAAAIGSDGPFGVGVRHGWMPVGKPMTVTSSSGTIIQELDSRPALEVYLEQFDQPVTLTDKAADFTRFALRHPLALARRTGEPLVRLLTGACPDEGWLRTMAAVPEGANVWLMTGDDQSVLDATDAACADAFADLAEPPKGVVVFDCITRRDMLGEPGIRREIDRIAEHAPGVPIAGLFTYGEIARTQGVNGFHHETLVVLAVG